MYPTGNIKDVTVLDTDSDRFDAMFKCACVDYKNWEKSVSAVLEPGNIFTFVETHAQYCKLAMNTNYNMSDLLRNKQAREACYLEIDLNAHQIFYGCPARKTQLFETLEMLAILIEYELYSIRYYREADMIDMRDPCIPGVGQTVLQYAPPKKPS